MLKTNEYFDGKVKSIALDSKDGSATIGVMEKGEYEFSTSSKEIMEVVSGKLSVKLPDSKEFRIYENGQTFEIDKNKSFAVIAKEETAYICYYK